MNEIAAICLLTLTGGTGSYIMFDIPPGNAPAFIWYGSSVMGTNFVRITCAEVKTDNGEQQNAFEFVNELYEDEVAGAWIPWRGVRCTLLAPVETTVLVCERRETRELPVVP